MGETPHSVYYGFVAKLQIILTGFLKFVSPWKLANV